MKFVQTAQPAVVTLLEEAIDINSGTLSSRGTRRVGGALSAQLEALGVKTCGSMAHGSIVLATCSPSTRVGDTTVLHIGPHALGVRVCNSATSSRSSIS